MDSDWVHRDNEAGPEGLKDAWYGGQHRGFAKGARQAEADANYS
jgi:hypothetical protein